MFATDAFSGEGMADPAMWGLLVACGCITDRGGQCARTGCGVVCQAVGMVLVCTLEGQGMEAWGGGVWHSWRCWH